MMTYHNTTTLDAGTRAKYERSAEGQESLILEYFRAMFPARLSPEQVHAAVLPDAPITSVRRAITDLTKDGHLVKCNEQVVGSHGRPVHVWSLAGKFVQKDLF